MSTLSILIEAKIKENKQTGFSSVAIPIEAYNHLCSVALQRNIFRHLRSDTIEMDIDYFINLISIAYYAETNSPILTEHLLLMVS